MLRKKWSSLRIQDPCRYRTSRYHLPLRMNPTGERTTSWPGRGICRYQGPVHRREVFAMRGGKRQGRIRPATFSALPLSVLLNVSTIGPLLYEFIGMSVPTGSFDSVAELSLVEGFVYRPSIEPDG